MAEERHEDRLERWARDGRPGTEPVPAATVILVRDGEEGLETLMLRRNSKIAFGGMWVFPGGRVDPGDIEAAPADDDLAAARRAAVREAEEETGLQLPDDALLAFSHWTPPPITPKRFLTWFFLASAPKGEVTIDQGEIHDHAWMRPVDALERRDAGEIELAPPTWVSLYDLSQWPSVPEALESARMRTPGRFETHISVGDEGPIALWQGDAGWPDSDATIPGPRHRLSMRKGRWHYDHDGRP